MKNRFFISGEIVVIEVYCRKAKRYFYPLVDVGDLDYLKKRIEKFYVTTSPYTNYIYCKTNSGSMEYLHRLILNTPSGLVVDHINHNGLDNRKKNIRSVTYSVNNGSNKRKSVPLNPYHYMYKGKLQGGFINE